MKFLHQQGEYRTKMANAYAYMFFFYMLAFFGVAQDREIAVRGYLFGDADIGIALDNANIQNLRTGRGAISLRDGYFQINGLVGDSIRFTSIGYKPEILVIEEKHRGRIIRVNMERSSYILEEVNVRSYKLTTNLPREMPQGKPMYKPSDQLKEPRPSKASLASPVDYIYQMFDKKIKQLEVLDEYAQRDAFKSKLEEGNNKQIVMEITGLSKEEFSEFVFFCRMGNEYIYSATDYELIMSLLRCYRQYKRVKDINEYMDDY